MEKKTQVHTIFVSEPIGNKPATDLPGIGAKLGKNLSDKGFDKANHVLGHFLLLKRNHYLFEEWLREISNANDKQANDCYNCLDEWVEQFL